MKWFLAALALLLAALVLESGLLAYAMYVLLGLMLSSRLLARQWLRSLEASRDDFQSAAEVGDSIRVSLQVRNRGWLPVPWVLLDDLLSKDALALPYPRMKLKGERVQLRMMRGRATTSLEYRLRPQGRGYFQIGPLVMETGDLFGLHRRHRVATEACYLTVYPKVVPLQGYDLASRRPIGEVRLSHRLYEDPTRINGVRQYQAGDPLNRIHWRASARTGLLHCKVYEPSSLSGATMLLDFHRDAFPSQGEPVRSELAVTAAASLAHAVHQLGQQIGLISNGRDAADRIRHETEVAEYRTRDAARRDAVMRERSERLRPVIVDTRRGAERFQQIRETLARLEMTDGMSFARMLTEAAHRVPRDATAVAVLAGVSPESAVALGALRRLGYAVSVILIMIPEQDFDQAYGRLRAEGLLDVRHLRELAELPTICNQQLLRITPYQMALAP